MPTQLVQGFQWLRTGEEALRAMLNGIDASATSIRMETYICRDGSVAQQFREALVRARQRGVRVQVLVDALGSISLPGNYWEPLTSQGGECRWFNPMKVGRWSYRDHRKVLVCDDVTAFIGGFNIADEYEGDGVTRGWRDLGMSVTGEAARSLGASFDRYFAHAAFDAGQRRALRKARIATTGDNWRLLLSNSGRYRAELKRTVARDIAAARSVRIISAYFLPTWRIRKALMNVCRRGGTVQLILAGKSDVLLSQLASRRLYNALFRGGVEIFEYQPQILHAKLFIMDDVVYAGSANLDTRSLRINHELLVRTADRDLARVAGEIFDADLRRSRRIDPVTWRSSRNMLAKLKEDWAYFFLARLDPYVARLQVKWLR